MTSTLLDDLGLLVIVGGLMKSAMRRPSVDGQEDDEAEAEDDMGGKRGDIKVGRCSLTPAGPPVESEMVL